MGVRAAAVTRITCIALAGALLANCGLPTPQPEIPRELLFITTNGTCAFLTCFSNAVAVASRDGSTVADLRSASRILVRLGASGTVAEGYLVRDKPPFGIDRFRIGSSLTTEVIMSQNVSGAALVEAPGLPAVAGSRSVLITKVGTNTGCDVVGYQAGSEIWRQPIDPNKCMITYENVAQLGGLAVLVDPGPWPKAVVVPETGKIRPLRQPSTGCIAEGEIAERVLYECGQGVGTPYVQVEGGPEVAVTNEFATNSFGVLEPSGKRELLVLSSTSYVRLDALGRRLSDGDLGLGRRVSDGAIRVPSGRPAVSADGASLYLPTDRGVVVTSVVGGGTKTIADPKTIAVAVSLDSRFLYALTVAGVSPKFRTRLDVIYLPTEQRVASYSEDASNILLVTRR